MLYFLGQVGENLPVFNVFRYITFRTAGAMVTAMFFVFMFGPQMIAALRIRQGKASRSARTAGGTCSQEGTPTMGRLMIAAAVVPSCSGATSPTVTSGWLFVTVTFGGMGL